MKISIIVPVYNVEDYLRDCIESVICQTHQDFELILVDDGSTDDSGAICDEYGERYSACIKVVHVLNGGPLRARLIGVRAATGAILMFLDSDDCLRNDALECISKTFDANNCDMVLFDAGVSNTFPSIEVSCSLTDGQIFNIDSKMELYEKIICGKIPNSLCLKAVRAECAVVPEYLVEYDLRHGEDLLLSAHFLTNCDNVFYIRQGLYFYRDRPGSAIHLFNIKKIESVKTVHTELEKCVDLWGGEKLKRLHNLRKVKGWIENLISLLKNRKTMAKSEFKKQLRNMSKDSYFRSAYIDMDKSQLSFSRRCLAFLLYYSAFLYKRNEDEKNI